MRLVLPRAIAARTLLAAAALAAVVTTVLLTAVILYAQLLPTAGARAALLDAPVEDRTVEVSSSAGSSADELSSRDAAVRDLATGGLAGVPLEAHAGGYSIGQSVPDTLPGLDLGAGEAYAVVAYLPDLAGHAELVEGAWPGPGGSGAPAEAALPAPVAEDLQLGVGDQVAILDTRGGDEQPAPVEVVGLWEPSDPAEPYWGLLADPLERDGVGPFVVHRDTFTARYQVLATLRWLFVPDPARLADADMAQVIADLSAMSDRLATWRQVDPALDRSVQLHTGLGGFAERLEVAAVVTRSGMVLPAALLVVIAGYGLFLVARLLAAYRRGENATMRARGASRRQLARFAAAESLLVVAPAALLGAPLGTRLVVLADENAGERSLGVAADLAPYGLAGPPVAWFIALVAAVGCAAALTLPAGGRGRTWVAEQQERGRPSRTAVLERAGVDLALVVLAVLAWTQLRQYQAALVSTDVGLGIDPLLVAAPVIGVVAAAAVALRLLPVATRLGVRLAGRRKGFAGLLGVWQADRRPHAGPVLLLVLAVATAVLAPAVAATWQRSQEDQAAHAIGADLRVTVANPTGSSRAALDSAVPAATGMMPVHRATVSVPGGERSTLLAMPSEPASGIVLMRPDLYPGGIDQLSRTLREGRPSLGGVPLPEGAQRLTGRVQVTAPASVTLNLEYPFQNSRFPTVVQLPGPRTDQLTAYVADADGVITAIQLGRGEGGTGLFRLDGSGGVDVDVPLPSGASSLVGLGATLSTPGTGFGRPLDTDRVPVSWQWELRTVADGGEAEPVEVPDTWDGIDVQEGTDPPLGRWNGADGTVSVQLVPSRDFPLRKHFLVAAPYEPLPPAVPVVVTPDVLAATGMEPGDTLSLTTATSAELPTMRIVDTAAALPGTEDGTGLLVDLGWLTTHQLLQQRHAPAPTEWWLSTPSAAADVALDELAWAGPVEDRRTLARELLRDPLGSGMLVTLWAAAVAAAVLAAFGLVTDSRATAVQRRRELAVLHTLGAPPRMLARALVVEHAVLAGLGVVAGVLAGVGVAAAMGTSLVLTAAGEIPVPVPLLDLSPAQVAAPTAGLLVVAVVLGAVVALRARREVAAGALRMGED